jgi:putative DNA primase/helicase
MLSDYILPIGCDKDNGRYVLLLNGGANLVRRFTVNDFTKRGCLLEIAPWEYWSSAYGYPDSKGVMRVDITSAAVALESYTNAGRSGMYNPDRIRGRGAWIDNGKPVIHMGSWLQYDGDHVSLNDVAGSSYFYLRGTEIMSRETLPLTTSDCEVLLRASQLFDWGSPLHGALFLGWNAIAPVCGGLDWRPHAWIVGDPSSGKSTAYKLSEAIQGSFALKVQGNTTYAGISQSLASDARPVLFDEIEKGEGNLAKVQAILEISRQAASDIGGGTVKGSATGSAVEYKIRSSFLFMSINDSVKKEQDKQRIAILKLRSPGDSDDEIERREKQFLAVEKAIAEIGDPEWNFSQRFLVRQATLLPVLKANIGVFKRVLLPVFKHQRHATVFGTLMAGYCSCLRDDIITEEEALEMIHTRGFVWSDFAEEAKDVEGAQHSIIREIMQSQIRFQNEEVTVGELIYKASTSLNGEHNTALGRYGIRVLPGDRIFIESTNKNLQRLLKDTVGMIGQNKILGRLPDTVSRTAMVRKGERSVRGLSLPLRYFLEEEISF